MKHLIFLLLFVGVARARAQVPARVPFILSDTTTTPRWHWGESVNAAVDRILARPGWTIGSNTPEAVQIDSDDTQQTVIFYFKDGKLEEIVYGFTSGLGLGCHVTYGATQLDEAHWVNPKERAAITHAYHRGTEIYQIKYAK